MFLVNCSAVATAMVAAPLRAFGEWVGFNPAASTDPFSFDAFSSQVNTIFAVHAAPGRVVRLKLVEASMDRPRAQLGRRPPPDADNEKFSIVFSGPRNELLPQEIFTLEHPKLGRMDLLLVPIFTRNPQKMDYEVVFNRPRSISKAG